MPWWMSRVAWRFRRKRLVRVHMDGPDGLSTIEGVRLGEWGGRIVLMLGKVPREGEAPIDLQGVIEIPKHREIWTQVLS